MRRRAYRPEDLSFLEDRSLLSGLASVSAQPVVLLPRQVRKVSELIRAGFDIYARDRELPRLSSQIEEVIVLIPFQKVDGLNESIDLVIKQMRKDLSTNPRLSIRSVYKDVIALIRADVDARIQAGDVVIH